MCQVWVCVMSVKTLDASSAIALFCKAVQPPSGGLCFTRQKDHQLRKSSEAKTNEVTNWLSYTATKVTLPTNYR